MRVDFDEDVPSGLITEDMAASTNEQESSLHDVGGDEVLAAMAPQSAVVEMAELRELLGDVHSLVTTLATHKHCMLQKLTSMEQRVSGLERGFIQFQDSLDAIRHEVTYTQTMLVTEGLIVPMPDNVATTTSARLESTHRLWLWSVARVRATYSADNPDC
ncbi:hypothetical protein NE237_017395 [Protea cynaroides]|uniref:Uncharacterized protein n=1 Tax=Protea cynaroides TaxID=273540 RepID=A0A9Q0K7W8_9MAGN|nr:hypothetical protein NE237_017395 [Protea cynaroides]